MSAVEGWRAEGCDCTIEGAGTRREVRILNRQCRIHRDPTVVEIDLGPLVTVANDITTSRRQLATARADLWLVQQEMASIRREAAALEERAAVAALALLDAMEGRELAAFAHRMSFPRQRHA